MKQVFLYRLFKHSKWAFAFVVLFIGWYCVSFSKKMDMIFFPYNSMYAVDARGMEAITTYAMKINGNPVKITHNPYWKKDLLETSLNIYCRYLQHDRNVFLNDYLSYRFSNENVRAFLTERLTPGKTTAAQWPLWFAAAAGYKVPTRASVEFMQYDFVFRDKNALLKDSISISNTIFP